MALGNYFQYWPLLRDSSVNATTCTNTTQAPVQHTWNLFLFLPLAQG